MYKAYYCFSMLLAIMSFALRAKRYLPAAATSIVYTLINPELGSIPTAFEALEGIATTLMRTHFQSEASPTGSVV